MQPWVQDFDPYAHNSSNAQVWIHLHSLPWEYWDPDNLAYIAHCFIVSMRIDKGTLDDDLVHYDRMLIDIDFSSDLSQTVGIERDGKELWVNVEYEKLPFFCKVCGSVGHLPFECRQYEQPSKPVTTDPHKATFPFNEDDHNIILQLSIYNGTSLQTS